MPETTSLLGSGESTSSLDEAVSTVVQPKPQRSWLLRRICSQNPFYLLSVWFVLRGTANWFHSDSGAAFSPWPLLALTAGYTLLMALTGFVIVRFGRVWDDARSILLIILMLFVQLSLIFDETLVREPATGRLLLLSGWAFSAVLSELLLRGLSILLPWAYRLPYHALLALLFVYPLWLVSTGSRLPVEVVSWRIVLFPVVASLVMLSLIPAIRCGRRLTEPNGTPWLWPWYPWSLFVFLGVCIGFRAYALSLSFDPVLDVSLDAALKFSSAFGVYLLVPLVLSAGLLLLEIGLAERKAAAVRIAMCVPAFCLFLSIPVLDEGGPYRLLLHRLMTHVGSPIWLTLIGAFGFHAIAMLRRVPSSETWLAVNLMAAVRIGLQTISLETLSTPILWPFVALAAVQLSLGLWQSDSHRVFVAMMSLAAAVQFGLWRTTGATFGTALQSDAMELLVQAVPLVIALVATYVIAAVFHDEFAWSLRVLGAPLLFTVATVSVVLLRRQPSPQAIWHVPAVVASVTAFALLYARLTETKLYQLTGLLCGLSGSLDIFSQWLIHLVHESGWNGAASFAIGLGWFVIAATVSTWKAGWLRRIIPWLGRMLIIEEHRPDYRAMPDRA